ncbi:hypothetical protein K9N68_35370 (plasmid) [Kovacikia minuta CCNUW1]|uniref:hypothetical protein n=1 Tax=Kovacikia minuta TaxID=2931930 RepID=UPI001CCC7C18|nr:hypothetical protein [Kovacikia minuta]UBF30472.1 hypothetical protein K9N68_35370 [Kovacikia minuta CCNUW1]
MTANNSHHEFTAQVQGEAQNEAYLETSENLVETSENLEVSEELSDEALEDVAGGFYVVLVNEDIGGFGLQV